MFECAMQIDGGEGVLLIIKNYTGDILNFETATELLHESGIKVTTVVVDDDVAVKRQPLYRRSSRRRQHRTDRKTGRRRRRARRLAGSLR